jgi:hypothetical protein
MHIDLRRFKQSTTIEWTTCLGATLAAVVLHIIYLNNAGGLWRDEASSVHLATMPTFGAMWGALDVPVLFPGLLRGWCAIGLGQSDFGLRVLGFMVGIAILGAIWLNTRTMGFGFPFISLGLLASSTTIVRWGDSLRPYGIACLFILLALGQLWALANQPTLRRFLLGCLWAILSVHGLYQSAFLVAAACSAASLVCLMRRKPRIALLPLAVGLSAAISLLPYIRHLTRFGSGYRVLRTGFNARVAWSSLSDALGSPMLWEKYIWICLLIIVGGIGIACLDVKYVKRDKDYFGLALFGATACGIGTAGFCIFLGLAQLPTQPWYFLPLMPFTAMCMDAAMAKWFAQHRAWGGALVGLICALSLPAALGQARWRQTNIDLLAAQLQEEAKPTDLIVVYPWYHGITFNRYYKGNTPWTTIPQISDLYVHRYDLVKEKLEAKQPIQPILNRISQALSAGNRLWIVGTLPVAAPDETGPPPDLPPAPEGPYGWSDVPYNYVWGRQMERFISAHGGQIELVPTNQEGTVSIYENASLSVAKGWAFGLLRGDRRRQPIMNDSQMSARCPNLGPFRLSSMSPLCAPSS